MEKWTAPAIASLRGDNTIPLQRTFGSLTEYLSLLSDSYLPAGGAAGQILSKIDGTDYNTQWIDNYAEKTKTLVKSDNSSTLPKGAAVYTSGANGTNILVKGAIANSEATSATVLGLLDQSLATNAQGYVVTEGLVTGIDTSAAVAGDPVWLSPTVIGGLTFGLANKPNAPYHLVYLGVVTRAHATNGEINVHMLNGWELEELHNVSALSPTTGDTIVYNASTSLWEKGKYPAGQLSGATLASNVVSSSLTSVGTITTGTWSGSFGAVSGANLTSLNASNLGSGTVPSARISGSYTGITGVGTLASLTIDGASSPSITIGDWSTFPIWASVQSTNGYLLLGNPSDLNMYLRTNSSGTAVHIGGNNQNALIVGSSFATIYGGTGTTITGTTQTLIGGSNNNSAIYLGGGTGNSATGGIEASWRDVANPSIAIGVTRDGNRTMTVYEYANSRMYFYGGGVQQAYIDAGGTRIQNYYGAVKYGSYGSISVYEESNGWYGIVFPSQATTWMSAANGQYFGCYRNNSTWNFYVINGTFVPSDERYKRDITPLSVGMNLLRLLEPISFDPLTEDPNDDPEATMGRINYGFTTQNVLASLQALGEPDNVNLVDVGGPTGANPETLSDRQYLNHSGLIAPIVKAIKELDSRLQQLEEVNGSANAS